MAQPNENRTIRLHADVEDMLPRSGGGSVSARLCNIMRRYRYVIQAAQGRVLGRFEKAELDAIASRLAAAGVDISKSTPAAHRDLLALGSDPETRAKIERLSEVETIAIVEWMEANR